MQICSNALYVSLYFFNYHTIKNNSGFDVLYNKLFTVLEKKVSLFREIFENIYILNKRPSLPSENFIYVVGLF